MAEAAEVEEFDVNSLQENLQEEVDSDGEEAEYSPAEQDAMDKGWNPDGVEGKPNLSAEEFLRNESFFKEIHKLKRDLKKNSEVIGALKEHNKQTSTKAYEKAVSDLKSAKKAAAEDDDLSRVIELDDQLDELRSSKQAVDATVVPEGLTEADFAEAYDAFTSANSWYRTNQAMTKQAELVYDAYSTKYPQSLPEDRFDYLMVEMKKDFPAEFGNKQRQRSAAVATTGNTSRSAATASRHTLKDVDSADRAIANTLIKNGVMTEKEYLADYFQD